MVEAKDRRLDQWPQRPWLLAVAGALSALAFHYLVDHKFSDPLAVWRQAGATFVAVASIAFIMTIERLRRSWAIFFALGAGLVLALVGWSTSTYNAQGSIFEWPYIAGLFAALLATPLFQTVRDEGRWSFPYARLHIHAWTDAVIGAASLAFTGVVFLLAQLIAALFSVIGIDAIRHLLDKGWFAWILAGFAFGASVGILREREALLGTLRRLVMIVYSVLSPVLAVALVAFLASIPFTGLGKLWDSGVPASPLLLLASAGAILLANAVFGDGIDDRSSNPILGWSAMALVAVVLPLAAIAALSMGIRVQQYGWTPERMWGVIAVAIALAYGIAAWWSLWLGRKDYDEPLRPLQVKLALGMCGIALFLALPIVDFGALSAASQIARLERGKSDPSKLDWAAMAFDFGPSGRERLLTITKTGPQSWRPLALTALRAKNRYALSEQRIIAGPRPVELHVFGGGTVPAELRKLLLEGAKNEEPLCKSGGACRVFPQSDGMFIAFMDGCANIAAGRRDDPEVKCLREPGVFAVRDGKWVNLYEQGNWSEFDPKLTEVANDGGASLAAESEALDRGDVRIVPVERHQIEVGGKRRGNVF